MYDQFYVMVYLIKITEFFFKSALANLQSTAMYDLC